jgi:hypothetical protein
MEQIAFTKNVSRGTRFNQVYIPAEFSDMIEAGDTVEVRLVRKQTALFYSAGLKELGEFKKKVMSDAFSIIKSSSDIKHVFAVGSFLTEKTDYHDVDIVIVLEKSNEGLEKTLYNELSDKINLKFHLLLLAEEKFQHLIKACPLTRAMFSVYVGDKKFMIPEETIVNPDHIRFLLMMPEDLLELDLNSRVFYDGLRRLITMERFLNNQKLDMTDINKELIKLIGTELFEKIKNNEEVDDKTLLRKIIKQKLAKIRGFLHG